MKKLVMTLSILTAVAVSEPTTAMANSQSMFTVAVGTELGMNQHTQIEEGTKRSFVSELTLRVRMLKFLGASFAYNLTPAHSTGDLEFTSTFRLSGLIYLVPTDTVSFYLTGGLGARKIQDLATISGSTNTYHAGGGLEFYIGDHFALHLEYLWLIPGARSIEDSVARHSQIDVQATERDLMNGASIAAAVDMPNISASDYLSPGNFQINFGLRLYL